MKISYFFGITTLYLLLSGCASVTQDIKTEAVVEPTARLSGYKSYAWLGDVAALRDPEGKWQPPKMNIADDIKFLIERELRNHGMSNYTQNPDLAAIFFMGVDMKAMKLKTDPKTKQENFENIPEASLLVALIDVKTDYVVWMGAATGEIQKNPTEETVRKRLDYAITEMFKKFPKD